MPYVPSEKTDGVSQDRNLIGAEVDRLAAHIVSQVTDNASFLGAYKRTFVSIGKVLAARNSNGPLVNIDVVEAISFANMVFSVGQKYGYWGAFLGELNYGITRLIQRVPQIMVENKKWPQKDELRYWAYACTVQALIYAAAFYTDDNNGIGGVFEDIKDEYKVRVNQSYEMAQIEKSGDCYDTPYYSRIVELLDETGKTVGKIYVNLPRTAATLHVDKLLFALPVRTLVNTATSK